MTVLPTAPPARAYAVHRDDAPSFWLIGILWQILATGALTGNRLSLMEEVCHAGSGPPTHTHEQDEGFYVLEGQCTFHAGGETIIAGPGTFASIPRRTGHAFSVDHDISRILNFYVPAGFELILMSIAAPAKELAVPDMDAVEMPPARLVEQLSRDYGQTKVLGLPFVDPPTPGTQATEPSATAPAKPFGSTRESAPAYWSHDILWLVHATGERTGGSYSVLEELCPYGSGAPPHAHEQDEGFYVIEGAATFLVGDRTVEAEAGSFVWVPRGTVHGFRVDSPTCRLLNVYSPGGFERVILETARPAERRELPPPGLAPKAVDAARLAALFADVGMRALAVADPLRPPPEGVGTTA